MLQLISAVYTSWIRTHCPSNAYISCMPLTWTRKCIIFALWKLPSDKEVFHFRRLRNIIQTRCTLREGVNTKTLRNFIKWTRNMRPKMIHYIFTWWSLKYRIETSWNLLEIGGVKQLQKLPIMEPSIPSSDPKNRWTTKIPTDLWVLLRVVHLESQMISQTSWKVPETRGKGFQWFNGHYTGNCHRPSQIWKKAM